MRSRSPNPEAGARNLLVECLEIEPGERIALICEDPALGFTDHETPACIAQVAGQLGCTAEQIELSPVDGEIVLPPRLEAVIEAADHLIFLSRIGDQFRFRPLPGQAKKTICYALDLSLLGSGFGALSHRFMRLVRRELERMLTSARRWRITCPLGSDLSGPMHFGAAADDRFTMRMFPELIFDPIGCAEASGRAALGPWLMATGNRRYPEDVLYLEAPVFAEIEAGRIADFDGPAELVERVRDHYLRVATLFDLDPWGVHSWHSGIHPECHYPARAESNIERWGMVAFGSPRYTHVHTCGASAPGEIAWSLFDCTIEIDGEVFWQDGRFVFIDRPEIRRRLAGEIGTLPEITHRDDIGVASLPSG